MPANTDPIFPGTVRNAQVQISTANANLDGTGAMGTLITGGLNGTRIEKAWVKAQVTTTAGMIRIFMHDGTNARLLAEIPVTANTISASNPAWSSPIDVLEGKLLQSGWSIRVSTHNAETFNVHCDAADY